MFDTPDLGPVCLAPFVAIFIGFIFYGFGSVTKWIFEHQLGKTLPRLKSFIKTTTVVIVPVLCIASVVLNIGAMTPLPWFEPTPKNIIGEWQLASSTIDALENWKNFPVKQHTLVFRDDGTFTMSDVPNFWTDFKIVSEDESYITGSGTWQITQSNDEYVIIANFHTLNVEQFLDSEIIFYFEKHLPPYQLVILGKENSLIFRFDKP